MDKIFNPYKSALDGLKLKNPVRAFFDFCIEREKIRFKRESGLPAPWSRDIIFQKGRFLNVFREDDRVSKSIIQFLDQINSDFSSLVQAVFFSRWCNRQETLDILKPKILNKPDELFKFLKRIKPWCNETAYPVDPIIWSNMKYSRLDAATRAFHLAKEKLASIIISSSGSVIDAVNEINNIFKMKNDFPIFMAVMDIAWFRPDIIKPNSNVPVGIGAVAYLDRLKSFLNVKTDEEVFHYMISVQNKYWLNAKRNFFPIDIEYLSCECRKYYSYVNGTKQFEGKNLFKPKN
ncbi:MAG: hypothetical protein CMF94_04050 [Candidatus Marinimicrobia bacterium]|nr:hypothetical protein [Candidatus Neomarinimicrobiota bacterium]